VTWQFKYQTIWYGLEHVTWFATIPKFVQPKLNTIKSTYHYPVIFASYFTLTDRTCVENDIVKTNCIPAPCPNTYVEKNSETVGVDGGQVFVLVNPDDRRTSSLLQRLVTTKLPMLMVHLVPVDKIGILVDVYHRKHPLTSTAIYF